MFVDLTIKDIITIEDTKNLFRASFEIVFQWQDYRLRFQNINSKKLNMLKSFEVEKLWEPILSLNDVNQFNRFVFVKPKVLYFIVAIEIYCNKNSILFLETFQEAKKCMFPL